MHYTVRTKDGSLTYSSMGEVEKAYRSGLIEPEDEVQEEGTTAWRKAGAIPVLANQRRGLAGVSMSAQLWTVGALFMAAMALYCLVKGKVVIGLVGALVVSFVLSRVTYKAFRGRKPPNF
jgi:hypothetical protein